jgi:hypothetical protein
MYIVSVVLQLYNYNYVVFDNFNKLNNIPFELN